MGQATEIDALVREAYRRGYEDRAKERDYDPGHAPDLIDAPPTAVPDGRTGRLLVKWRGVTFSLTPEDWEAFRVATARPIPPGSDTP